ncbi:MAG: hypothetical protein M0032_04710 [Actinomycetota bacterium]|jgi:hypothetical protein|nr:hypothetical protein [Actinomycetota bacterium]
MTRPPGRVLEFGNDPSAVLAAMATVRAAGRGWVNVQPVVDPEDEPPRPGLLAIFGGSPHRVPLATWLPSPGAGNREARTTVGILHATGRRLASRLAEAQVGVPAGWRVTQDHLRRGLVVEVAAGADDPEVLSWIVAVLRKVTTVRSSGTFRALVYGPASSDAPSG